MSDKTGKLYLVPTPIGNLEDITYRAVRILREVDLIAAEDTRHTGLLLSHLGISQNMVAYHEHNKAQMGAKLIEALLAGKNIAVVSDAGMPAISDPGADLVALALAAQLTVVPLPGPNAALTALIASGLDATEFTFLGFLPKRSSHRLETLRRVAAYEGTLLLYEAPHRLKEILPDLLEIWGNRPLTIGRELTKMFETFTRTTLQDLCQHTELLTYKGEFVLVVGGALTRIDAELDGTREATLTPVEAVQVLMEQGIPKKEAIREVAKQRGLARRDVYNAVEAAEK